MPPYPVLVERTEDYHIEATESLVERTLRTLKNDDLFAVFDSQGNFAGGALGPDGLFYKDTRFLSEFTVRLGGAEPLQLGSVLTGRDLTGLEPVATVALNLPNSRNAESEADRYGVELAARAGYDPRAAVTLWEKMIRATGGNPPQFLSTHPNPENRIQALQALVPRMMPIYQQARG